MNEVTFSYDREIIFKRLNDSIKIVRVILSKTYSTEEIDSILEGTIEEVDTLLPEIPYIGGKENFSLNDFFDSILMLALFKQLKTKGSAVRDIGQVMYEIRELQASQQSKFSRFLYSKLLFTSFIKKSQRKKIDIMLEKNYPENWKMEYVEGDGIEFDWGVNFHDCAVRKLYLKHGGEELLPFVCMSDYAPFHAMKGVEFKRTQTLSGGGKYCDFRFKKGGSTPRGWPPEEREDFVYNKD